MEWDDQSQVERYLDTKHVGDSQPFLDHLAHQLEKIQSIQVNGKSAQIHFKDKFIQLSGDQLDSFIPTSAQLYNVVQYLSYDENLMAEASNLGSFETAADGDTDEPQKTEIEISPAPENNRLNNLMSGNLDLT